jgi:hypothetical protein
MLCLIQVAVQEDIFSRRKSRKVDPHFENSRTRRHRCRTSRFDDVLTI